MSDYSTRIPALHNQFVRDLRTGNLPKVVETSVQIEMQEPSLPELLDDFESAVSNGDKELARTLVVQIQNQLEQKSTAEQQEIARASVAAENSNISSEDREALLKLVRSSPQVSLQRSQFYNQAVAYLQSEGETTAKETAETASRTRKQEESFEQTRSQTPEPDTESVKPKFRFLTTESPSKVSEGTTYSIDVKVSNVGGSPASDVSLEVGEVNGATPATQTVSLEQIPPNETQKVSLEINSPVPTEARVPINLRYNGEIVDSTSDTTRIIDRTVSVREAITGEPESVLNTAEIQQAISHWSNDEPVPGTGGESVSTEKIQSFVTEWVKEDGGTQ
jgi:uncharacterized membrane protein